MIVMRGELFFHYTLCGLKTNRFSYTKKKKPRMNLQRNVINVAGPTNVFRTLTLSILCLLCCISHLNSVAQNISAIELYQQSENDKYSLQESELYQWLCMLAANVWLREPPCHISYYRLRGTQIQRMLSQMHGVNSQVFIEGLLLTCGDVEPNPGPKDQSPSSQRQHDQPAPSDPLSQLRQDTNMIKEAIIRIERFTRDQSASIEKSIEKLEDKITGQLHSLEDCQVRLCQSIDDISLKCRRLEEDNRGLQESVKQLMQKVDILDNCNRKNNIVVFGLNAASFGHLGAELEDKVRDVIQSGLGITEKIDIENIYRSGPVVVVSLLSLKQKTLIMKNAGRLRETDSFRHIYINEDLSESVRRKRRCLLQTRRDLRSMGQRVRWKYDKLVTDDAVFSIDNETNEVVKKVFRRQTSRNQQQQQPHVRKQNSNEQIHEEHHSQDKRTESTKTGSQKNSERTQRKTTTPTSPDTIPRPTSSDSYNLRRKRTNRNHQAILDTQRPEKQPGVQGQTPEPKGANNSKRKCSSSQQRIDTLFGQTASGAQAQPQNVTEQNLGETNDEEIYDDYDPNDWDS